MMEYDAWVSFTSDQKRQTKHINNGVTPPNNRMQAPAFASPRTVAQIAHNMPAQPATDKERNNKSKTE
jgi:hypothetical protein